jgi:hypothetical protein
MAKWLALQEKKAVIGDAQNADALNCAVLGGRTEREQLLSNPLYNRRGQIRFKNTAYLKYSS